MTTILAIPNTTPRSPFAEPIEAFLDQTNAPNAVIAKDTAAHIVETVSASSDPSNALWQLWDAFFDAVVSSTDYTAPLALLRAIQEHTPTRPTSVGSREAKQSLRIYTDSTDGSLDWSSFPRFSAIWRDVHDILESRRDWDGVREAGEEGHHTASSLPMTGTECFVRFVTFSADMFDKTGSQFINPMNVFYACKNVLERKSPEVRPKKAHRMSAERVRALDVRVVAIWICGGGRALWEMDEGKMR